MNDEQNLYTRIAAMTGVARDDVKKVLLAYVYSQPQTEIDTYDLADKLIAAAERVKAMTPEEREAMRIAQRDSYAKAELAMPKPNFKWVNGAKVYDSYEDYCND